MLLHNNGQEEGFLDAKSIHFENAFKKLHLKMISLKIFTYLKYYFWLYKKMGK